MKKYYKLLCCYILIIPLFTSLNSVKGQVDKEYWFAAPEVSKDGSNNFDIPIVLRISTLNAASNITVSQPANSTFVPINISIPANSTYTIDLSSYLDSIESKPANTVLNYGLHILSTQFITAYYEVVSSYCNCNPEIYSLKGKNALGTYFLIPSQTTFDNNSAYNNPTPYSTFDIVATENNTNVTITPSHNIVGHLANSTFTVSLNKGQVYSAKAMSQLGVNHLQGSSVNSNKPIAITYNDDLLVSGICSDLVGDQIIPVAFVGTEYIVVKGELNTEKVYLLGTQNNTDVFLNGNSIPVVNIGVGQTYEFTLSNPSVYINISKPAYLLHISGNGCEMGAAILPPINCTGSKQIGFTRSNSMNFYLNLTVRSGAEGSFTLNGSTSFINASMFSVVPGTGGQWKFAHILFNTTQVPIGTASLISNSTDVFHMGIINGGTIIGCSYGYFSNFSSLNLGPDIVKCPFDSIVLDAGAGKDSYLWSTGDTTQSIITTNIGSFWVKATKGICVISDTIIISEVPLTINLGNDTTICQGSQILLNAGNSGSNYLWNTGQTTQTINVTSSGTYSVKVTNSSGCTGKDTITVGVITPIANFNIPDTVCTNQNISIQNTTTCGSSYYWNFCSGNLSTTPIGINMGNLGSLSNPVYSTIAKDGNNYYVFITNHVSGTLTRLSFGNSLINIPTATNLGSLGVMGQYIEAVQVKKDGNGNWYGLVAGGQNNYLGRINFGTSLANTPTMVNLGNIGGTFNYPHSLYIFQENNNWYGFVSNINNSTIVRLSFGSSLSNTPTAVNLGNIGGLNYPLGLVPVLDNGTWYILIVNRNSNSISRLNFGNSFLNIPTGVNLGSVNGTINTPRFISILRDCDQVFGFVVNEGNDIVRLAFSNGLTNNPTGTILGNIANLNFPHHISELFRVGDSLYTFIMNVNSNTISRLCFPSCTNASVASSSLQNPPVYSYNSPGTYNVSLVVNEGLPSQLNICKDIVVIGPNVNFGNDTIICQGSSLTLNAANVGASYLWSTGATSQQINFANSGTYWVKVTNSNGCFARDTIIVNSITNLIVNLGKDTSICQGDGLLLNAGNTGSNFQWSTGANTQAISIQSAGDYWVQVNNNICYGSDTIHVIAVPKPIISIGNDTIMCPGNLIILTPGLGFSQYLWSDGSVLSHLNVSNPGTYSVIVFDGLCSSSDTIFIDECGSEISVPNIFTPNGDGINEFFAPVYTNIDKITLYIYNRWGNQLYEGSGKSAFWDGLYYGKLCSDGVYYYLIGYENKGRNKGMRQLHGSVTLLH